MAHSLMLQDWITLTGGASQVVIQDEAAWLDIGAWQDLAVFFEVSNLSNGNNTLIDLQTSPTKDDTFFTNASQSVNKYLVEYSLNNTFTAGLQTVKVIRWATATDQIPSRFLRWRVTFPTLAPPTNLTFRLWLSLNQAGWR